MSLFEAPLVYRMLSGAVQLLTKAPNRSISLFCPIRTEARAFRRNPERGCPERFRFSSNRENAHPFVLTQIQMETAAQFSWSCFSCCGL